MRVRTTCEETGVFPATKDLHQRSGLSPYYFTLIINELTVIIKEEIPWCMLFVDLSVGR